MFAATHRPRHGALLKPKGENGSDFGSAIYLSCQSGTLDGFNHILDFDEGLTDVFRVSAILFLRQSSRDVAAVRNLSISCCDQLLNVFVILSHSGGLLLINLFAQQLRQLGDIRRNPPRSHSLTLGELFHLSAADSE
jgi:hypothetical protein